MGAIIQNGNVGAIIQNGVVYAGNVIQKSRNIVSAGISYEGYDTSGLTQIHIPLFLKANDTVVFAISARSALTLPIDVIQLYQSDSSWNVSGQFLTFAKYTASQDEQKNFLFEQINQERFFVSYAIFNDVTVFYTGKFNTIFSADNTRTQYDVPDKINGDILFWTYSTSTFSSSGDLFLNSFPNDLYKQSWLGGNSDKAPRHESFLDDGRGATSRYFKGSDDSIYVLARNPCVIDAVEIVPNYSDDWKNLSVTPYYVVNGNYSVSDGVVTYNITPQSGYEGLSMTLDNLIDGEYYFIKFDLQCSDNRGNVGDYPWKCGIKPEYVTGYAITSSVDYETERALPSNTTKVTFYFTFRAKVENNNVTSLVLYTANNNVNMTITLDNFLIKKIS